ncbi:hypothetical protein WJX73_001020 [Symbiochloris irregularis]|uniref:EamA domain-containing protein n=1 Tax=Symbiochloris irregularis TaxID=706552 RepID=A0AAW1PDU6_9CHLO
MSVIIDIGEGNEARPASRDSGSLRGCVLRAARDQGRAGLTQSAALGQVCLLTTALLRGGLLTGSTSSKRETRIESQGTTSQASQGGFLTGALLAAGFELGLWNFAATASQALALEATTATRGAFLLQATTVITPVLSTVAGLRPHRQVWFGCCIALAGTLLINLDRAAPSASTALNPNYLLGDAGMLSAAFFYSLATVRLGSLASNLAPLRLAASKSCALALFAIIWLCAYALSHGIADSGDLQQLWPSSGSQVQWILVLYSALGPGAIAAWLQVQGQREVPPAQAQVLYATVPLWAALVSYVALSGDERLGPFGWLGGVTITVASLVASRAPRPADRA